MRKARLLALTITLALSLGGCPDKVTVSTSRQLDEDCDASHNCLEGLYCQDGKCRQLCKIDDECPSSAYYCRASVCVKYSDVPVGAKEGESCSSQIPCSGNLLCIDGICKKPCTQKSDCRADEICESGRCKPEILPERGEACNAAGKCAAGLTCIEQVCQKTCVLDEECGDENLICDKKICGPKPDKPIGPSGREEIKPRQGGILTPVSGLIENDRFKVRVMGGALQGEIKNEQNSARLIGGAWDAKSEE